MVEMKMYTRGKERETGSIHFQTYAGNTAMTQLLTVHVFIFPHRSSDEFPPHEFSPDDDLTPSCLFFFFFLFVIYTRPLFRFAQVTTAT